MKNYLGKDPESAFVSYLYNKKKTLQKSLVENETGNINIQQIEGRKLIEIDGIKIALDCWDETADLIFVSHAHMDHIPHIPAKSYQQLKKGELNIQFLCSPITKAITEVRTRGRFKIPPETWLLDSKENADLNHGLKFKDISLKLLENGHTPGSTSLFIEGTETILYTGDFLNAETETLRTGLNPIACDHLILECTYGSPRYTFPSFEELIRDINTYIGRQLSNGHPVILLCYAFGKSQNLLKFLDNSFIIILERQIAEHTKILEKYGIKFPKWKPYGDFNKKSLSKRKDFVLLIPPFSIFKSPYKDLKVSGAKVAALSGKIFNSNFIKEIPADAHFPFSDHCDFYQLLDFVDRCKPNNLYIETGRFYEFFYYLNSKIHSYQSDHVKIL